MTSCPVRDKISRLKAIFLPIYFPSGKFKQSLNLSSIIAFVMAVERVIRIRIKVEKNPMYILKMFILSNTSQQYLRKIVNTNYNEEFDVYAFFVTFI